MVCAALRFGPQARHRAGQFGGADRQRLPGSVDGQCLEPQQRGVHDRAVGAHRATGCRARGAGAIQCGHGVSCKPARRGRVWLDREVLRRQRNTSRCATGHDKPE